MVAFFDVKWTRLWHGNVVSSLSLLITEWVSKENMTQRWMWDSFAVIGKAIQLSTERQSDPATDFFSSEANEKLISSNPSVQLYLAETKSSTYLQKEVEQLASGSIS